MTDTLDRREAARLATEARLDLLRLGYTPLPARGKMCLLEGWPRVRPDAGTVAEWGKNLNFCTSGIRLDGHQIAIDVDVEDETLVNDLLDDLFTIWPALEQAPRRIGKAPKELYLALLSADEAPLTRAATAKWRPAGGGDWHQIEVFGGGGSRFIGWAGPHTLEDQPGPDGWIVHRMYQADDLPAVTDLPVITGAQLRQWLARADAIFEAAGWEKFVPPKAEGADGKPVYDLTDDMVFECNDGVIRRGLAALAEYGAGENARCSASFIEPGASNTSRCRIKVSEKGSVYIKDYESYTVHMAPTEDRPPVDLSSLGAALASVLGSKPPREAQEPTGVAVSYIVDGGDVEGAEAFDSRVDWMLEHLAFVPDGNGGGGAVYIAEPTPFEARPLSMASLRNLYCADNLTVIGPKGGTRKVSPVDAWVASSRRVTVNGFRFEPGVPDKIVVRQGREYINAWHAPVVDEAAADPEAEALWEEFLRHLVPDDEERAWLEDWLAWKFVNPRWRGPAVLMVAENVQGTGRNFLARMVGAAFGGYVARVSAAQLFGADQFTAWRANSLFAFGSEIAISSNYRDKFAAYETLKDLVDPADNEAEVNIKFGAKFTTEVFTSYLLATNSVAALPIRADDRRFAVIANGTQMSMALRDRLAAWLPDGERGALEGFVQALRCRLRRLGEAVRSKGGMPMIAPRFALREVMIEEGESDADGVMKAVLAAIPAATMAISVGVLEARLKVSLAAAGEGKVSARALTRHLGGESGRRLGWVRLRERVNVGAERKNLYVVVRADALHEYLSSTLEHRAEVTEM